MIDALLRNKANAIQVWCVNLWEQAYGSIGSAMFLRCLTCYKIVPPKKILKDGKCACGGRRVKETNLSFAEELYWIGRAIIWKMFKKS